MTISKDLFLAILSMDSYNRGYNSGINFSVPNSNIGNAVVYTEKGDAEAQSAGFFAVAYDTSAVFGFSAGEKTIAYRGTDRMFPNFTSFVSGHSV